MTYQEENTYNAPLFSVILLRGNNGHDFSLVRDGKDYNVSEASSHIDGQSLRLYNCITIMTIVRGEK